MSEFCTNCDDASDTLITLHCRCEWCLDCIQRGFELARTEDNWPVRCCSAISFDDMKQHLPSTLIEELERKIPEYKTPARQRAYCANKTCLKFISVDNVQNNIATCPSCNEKTCVKCKFAHHEGDCKTDEALQETLALSKDSAYQRCKECGQMVEHAEGGCPHMTCFCSHKFCFYCGEALWHWDACQKKK